MRRFLFAAFAMIAMALPGCAPAVAPPPPSPHLAPPVALLPPGPPAPAASMPRWRPADYCPDPVTRAVPVYWHTWYRHHRVTRVRWVKRIVACNRYHPPSVIVGER